MKSSRQIKKKASMRIAKKGFDIKDILKNLPNEYDEFIDEDEAEAF